MRKLLLVAGREYSAAVKTKAFVIGLLVMPLLIGATFVLQRLLAGSKDTSDRRVAVMDHTGRLYGELAAAAGERTAREVVEEGGEEGVGEESGGEQLLPRFVLEQVLVTEEERDATVVALSDRVREGDLFAYVEIGREVFEPVEDGAGAAVRYHSNTPTYDALREWLRGEIEAAVQEARFDEAGIDPAMVERVLWPTTVENLGLVTIDPVSGEVIEAERVDEFATRLVPSALMVLMFMVVFSGAAPLVQTVLEEKQQRIAEVLLGSVSPFVWLMGKLVGMAGVALTIAGVYVAGGLFLAWHFGVLGAVPLGLLVWFAFYAVLGVLMYGAIFAAVGAACSDAKDTQSALTPLMIVVMLPMFVWFSVVDEPASTFALLLSLIPPLTPMLMLLRQAVPPGVALWQPLLGTVLVGLSAAFCIFVGSRIFRVGILIQGKGAKLSEMVRWAIRG